MNMFSFNSDFEQCFIIILLLILAFMGLQKRKTVIKTNLFFFDREFSGILKGIACVMILLAHYEAMMHYDVHYPYIGIIARNLYAYIGLVWFMFVSGYGLTMSKSKIENHFKACMTRCCKVLLPMAFVFVVSLILYFILPIRFSEIQMLQMAIPDELFILHHISGLADIKYILLGSFRWYWYVWCILMFYIMFFLSDFLAIKVYVNKTLVLVCLLATYYIFAFYVFGSSNANYYRLTGAFLLGHIMADWNNLVKKQRLALIIVGFLPLFNEDIYMVSSFIFAIFVILVLSVLNLSYTFEGKTILKLGSISYFFYLVHRRIAWVICCYLNITDLLAWIGVTIIFASMLYWFYNRYYRIIHII